MIKRKKKTIRKPLSGLPNAWGKENEMFGKKNHCDQNKPTFIEFIKKKSNAFFTGQVGELLKGILVEG